MRYVGRWIESLKDAVFPAPHELVGEYDANIRQRVVDYLQAGYTLRLYRGYASCLFACGFTLPHSELTDGKWVWPCNLAHYVEYHNVRVRQNSLLTRLKTPPSLHLISIGCQRKLTSVIGFNGVRKRQLATCEVEFNQHWHSQTCKQRGIGRKSTRNGTRAWLVRCKMQLGRLHKARAQSQGSLCALQPQG